MSGQGDGNAILTEGAFKITRLKTLNEECQLKCKESSDAVERAKQELNEKRQGADAMLYQVNRLRRQIDEDRSVKATQIINESKLKAEFNSHADEQLKQRAQLSDHDHHLALLEFELIQRRHMNGILKQKQEELLKLKSEIMDKEENLSLLEPGLKQLMEATKPLLNGLELELESLSEKIEFESFDQVELADSLMCLYRQCRARQMNKNDILVKYQGPNRFTVEITGANLEVSYHDKFGCAFIRSSSSLDHVGVQGDLGCHVPNMFGQVACNDSDFQQLIKSGWRRYRWLQNMCGIELIL